MSDFLAWINQHARLLLACSVFLGILAPPLAEYLRPFLPVAVIGTLTGALLRMDWSLLGLYFHRPGAVLALSAWQLLVTPVLAWGVLSLVPLSPELSVGLVLQAAAPPIGSAAVFTLLLGINAGLSLVTTLLTTLLLPLTLTPLVAMLATTTAAGVALSVDLATFFVRVCLMVLAPFVIAGVLRWWLGESVLRRHDHLTGALNVLLLMVFAIAVMDGVTARLLADPGFISLLLLLACVIVLLLHALGYWVFVAQGQSFAINASVCSGNRNMGLILAVTAGSAGEVFSLYVGVAQIPMYFAPLILAFVLRRVPLFYR